MKQIILITDEMQQDLTCILQAIRFDYNMERLMNLYFDIRINTNKE